MSKRLITSGGSFVKSPTVRLTQVDGSMFTGKMLGSRDTKFGLAFQMAVIEGTAPIQIKESKEEGYKDVDVSVGDAVDVLTSKNGQLETKLKQVKLGETAEIIFKSKVLNPKTGRSYNEFEVNIIE